jgi:hypothetical protein
LTGYDHNAGSQNLGDEEAHYVRRRIGVDTKYMGARECAPIEYFGSNGAPGSPLMLSTPGTKCLFERRRAEAARKYAVGAS